MDTSNHELNDDDDDLDDDELNYDEENVASEDFPSPSEPPSEETPLMQAPAAAGQVSFIVPPWQYLLQKSVANFSVLLVEWTTGITGRILHASKGSRRLSSHYNGSC